MGKRQKKKSKANKKKANRTNKRAIIDLPVAPINYEHHIPVYDFFENVDLNTGDGLGECIDNFFLSGRWLFPYVGGRCVSGKGIATK